MFDDLMGAYGSRFLLAAGGVGIALLLLIAVLWIMRNRAPSPFVRGGRNRQPRLQVLDAAAVDARRRLVLVRRDDVEHLIMIGGPSDIVIESRILPDDEAIPEPAPVTVKERLAMVAEAAPVTVPAPRQDVAMTHSPRPEELYVPEPTQIEAPLEPPVAPIAAPPSPVVAERERAAPPAPFVEPQQPQSYQQPASAPIEAAVAADILDAARQRVLQQPRIEPQMMAPPVRNPPIAPAAQSFPTPTGDSEPAPVAPAAHHSDFQRILEEEMTSTLAAAERIVPAPNTPARPLPTPGHLPRRDPEMAPITGADADLQNEVARIFGEMSVNRDK